MSDVAPLEMTMRECEGLAFIGDPHVCSLKPGYRFGRRTDDDYPETILGKLKFVIDHCNENRLVPVFLGDMYDKPAEPSKAIETRLLRLLKTCWTQPITNVGNHDITNQILTDGDSLKYLEEAGVIRVAVYSGALDTFVIGGKTVAVGATPYGQEIPTDAKHYFPKADTIIWLTHHDLAFEGSYPGAQELHAIKGCRLAINGHMHIAKELRPVGGTTWFNPGNIVRQAVDAIEHVPAITVLTAEGRLKKVVIPHEKSVFDLTGKLIDSISPGEIPKEVSGDDKVDSAFVSLLQADSSMEMGQTQDGSILMEDIQAKFKRDNTDDFVKSIVLNVLQKSVERKAA
ncbi:metallophosphoesterase [Rhizobium sp. BK176]|uniref:metallophosphoesterase n=1 Tax=Rhizobium sp. BK176 TaxID=2587071 RepID=UPI0021691AA1|nr:metallophosphoesterase [Rhizobium sp. BK176]MCS4089536.1 putative phosphodiesterase [Rhizobium sp. BK176]